MTVLHLGIDFGTSASKVVARDHDAAGDSKAYALEWELVDGDPYRDPYRLSSDVAVVRKKRQTQALFGHRRTDTIPGDPRWFTSLKMKVKEEMSRAAREPESQAAREPDLPRKWTKKHLLTASLTWLVRVSMTNARERARVNEATFTGTFGLPNDFRADPTLKSGFLHIFRAAWSIARNTSVFPHLTERRCITLDKEAFQRIERAWQDSIDDGDENVDWWHQSEARASALWAWNTPAFAEGAYINVDIGAGTTNAVAYLVAASWVRQPNRQLWVNDRISVFGAASGDIGMDTLGDPVTAEKLVNHGETILQPYRQAWGGVRDRAPNGAPAHQWRNAKIVALGGGSTVEELVKKYQFHPTMRSELELLSVDTIPEDLDMDLGKSNERARKGAAMLARRTLTVAYGLSANMGMIREIEPTDIAPIARDAMPTVKTLEGIYAR